MVRFLFAVIALLSPLFSLAQIDNQSQLTVQLSPANPRPYETVTAYVKSSYVNLNGAKISYYINGAKQDGAEKQFSFDVGAAGSRTILTVEVVENGQLYQQSVTVYPAEVSLILESLAPTPLFYKGASLVAPEGNIRIVALPNIRAVGGSAYARENLIYEWKLGSKNLDDFSGVGKYVLEAIAPPRYRDATVSLTVSSPDRQIVAYAEFDIDPVEPLLRVYRKDPLMGTLSYAILPKNYQLTGDEESFTVEPFYFGATPSFLWTVGKNQTQGKDLTVRRSGEGAGKFLVNILGTDSEGISSATSDFTILFNKQSTQNIFGL